MSPKGKDHRSRKSKTSSSSSRRQHDEIPVDPNLIDPSLAGHAQAQDYYNQAGPSNYAPTQWPNQQQQPTTVDPNDLWLPHGGSSSSSAAAAHDYYANAGPADQDANHEEQAGPSSAATATQDYQCQDCGRICHGLRNYNKHAKTHNKPISCEADENCTETKAEQRDMNRHYISAHKEFAAGKGLITSPLACDYPGCGKTFTRHDNLLKHCKKFHNAR